MEAIRIEEKIIDIQNNIYKRTTWHKDGSISEEQFTPERPQQWFKVIIP